MTKKFFLPALVLIAALVLACPAAAETINLSQAYSADDATFQYHKWEMIQLPFSTTAEDSAIMWIRFYSMPTSGSLVFEVTHNDLTSEVGSIIRRDLSLIDAEVETSLGGISQTRTYSKIPFIGVAPAYVLAYGVDSSGYHYLVLLPTDRIGTSMYDGRNIVLDTETDPHVLVNPPAVNPIIHLDKTPESGGVMMDAYTATITQLIEGPAKKEDHLGDFLDLVGGLIGIFMFAGVFLITNLAYVPLAMVIGEALLFLYCLNKSGDVLTGGGMFIEKNLYFLEIVQRILEYGIRVLYLVWDALVKWI